MPFRLLPGKPLLFRVIVLLLLLIALDRTSSSRLFAVELPLLTYGPTFTVELNPLSGTLQQQLREALLLLRQSNTEMAIGSIITVVAVLLIHMLRSEVESMNPNTKRRGETPVRLKIPNAMRKCS